MWVRFAPGLTGGCCTSIPDLLKTVRNLLTGKAVIGVVTKKGAWVETTFRPAGTKPVLRPGQNSGDLFVVRQSRSKEASQARDEKKEGRERRRAA